MMAPATVVPPPIATSSVSPPITQSTSPTSTRSRIRAPLNYLRSYHHSSSQPPTAATTTTTTTITTENTTAPSGTATTTTTTTHAANARPPILSGGSGCQVQSTSTTTSWVPTVGGVSGLSRVPSAPSAEASTATGGFRQVTLTMAGSGDRLGIDALSHPTREINGDTTISTAPGLNTDMATNGVSNSEEAFYARGRNPSIRFMPFIDHRSHKRPLTFQPMERTIKLQGEIIKVGRFSDRDKENPVGFKSKVVSRRHCEFWWDANTWWVKDVGSSSGTFLNTVRLSAPNIESKPFQCHDGDLVQLGMDFKGGEELIFRCVKIKLELNRDVKGPNQFNVAAHKRIQNLGKTAVAAETTESDKHNSECAICLLNIAPCQSLFVAPCSHVWHYKCIRTVVEHSYPIFLCPNCRELADLDAEIDESSSDNYDEDPVPAELKQVTTLTPSAPPNGVAAAEPARSYPPTTSVVEAMGNMNLDGSTNDNYVMRDVWTPSPPRRTSLPTDEGEMPMGEDANGEAVADPNLSTPRNDAGPFIFNGTTGRM